MKHLIILLLMLTTFQAYAAGDTPYSGNHISQCTDSASKSANGNTPPEEEEEEEEPDCD